MNCTDIRPLLSAYYDGETTPEEHNQVEKHLATCQDCRHAMADYRAIGGGVRALPVPVPPAGLRRDVWRAIEAQQGTRVAAGATRSGKVSTIAAKRRERRVLGTLTNIGSAWGKAIPAAAMLAAMLLLFALFLVVRENPPAQAATLVEDPNVTNYGQVLHVQFSQPVVKDDAEKYTTLRNVQDDQVTKAYDDKTRQLTISPKTTWKAGENYQIVVDAPKIRTGVADQPLSKEPVVIDFGTLAYTHTPTSTSIPTRTSVPTSTATHTAEPTATPQDTPVGGTPLPVTTTPTTEPSETNTPMPSATPTVVPSLTPTVKATQTPTATPTSGRKGTPTPTPRAGTPTPTPPCNIMPVNGFGKLWREDAGVRARLGCPTASEIAIQRGAHEHFQGGYMFWRGDTNMIYVFLGSGDNGDWYQFEDTWQDGDPTPLPGPVPPSGLYAPVRGFGKVWRENPGLRQGLGWATDQEVGIPGAWQPFASGDALWTSDRHIRLLYDDTTWEGYPDTYITPTAVPSHAPPLKP